MVRVPAVHKTGASGPDRMASSNDGEHKSFVDDLNTERGIVSTREVSVPRSAEIPPLFSDLSNSSNFYFKAGSSLWGPRLEMPLCPIAFALFLSTAFTNAVLNLSPQGQHHFYCRLYL